MKLKQPFRLFVSILFAVILAVMAMQAQEPPPDAQEPPPGGQDVSATRGVTLPIEINNANPTRVNRELGFWIIENEGEPVVGQKMQFELYGCADIGGEFTWRAVNVNGRNPHIDGQNGTCTIWIELLEPGAHRLTVTPKLNLASGTVQLYRTSNPYRFEVSGLGMPLLLRQLLGVTVGAGLGYGVSQLVDKLNDNDTEMAFVGAGLGFAFTLDW